MHPCCTRRTRRSPSPTAAHKTALACFALVSPSFRAAPRLSTKTVERLGWVSCVRVDPSSIVRATARMISPQRRRVPISARCEALQIHALAAGGTRYALRAKKSDGNENRGRERGRERERVRWLSRNPPREDARDVVRSA